MRLFHGRFAHACSFIVRVVGIDLRKAGVNPHFLDIALPAFDACTQKPGKKRLVAPKSEPRHLSCQQTGLVCMESLVRDYFYNVRKNRNFRKNQGLLTSLNKRGAHPYCKSRQEQETTGSGDMAADPMTGSKKKKTGAHAGQPVFSLRLRLVSLLTSEHASDQNSSHSSPDLSPARADAFRATAGTVACLPGITFNTGFFGTNAGA